MKNFIRLLTLLVMGFFVSEGYGQRPINGITPNYAALEFKATSPYIKKVEKKEVKEDSVIINVFSEKVNIRVNGGYSGTRSRNLKDTLVYDIKWQYKIEGEEWKDFLRYEGEWITFGENKNLTAPEGWGGTLTHNDSDETIYIKKVDSYFNIPIDEKYREKNLLNIKVRTKWDIKLKCQVYYYRSNTYGRCGIVKLSGESDEESLTIYQCKGGFFDISEGYSLPRKNDHFVIYDEEEYKRNHKIQFSNTSRETVN